jgi:carbamoyltransferase
VLVPPAPGDAGCALGAALWADRIHFGQPDRELPDHPFWGPVADEAELGPLAAEDGLEHTRAPPGAGDVLDEVAGALAAGEIVGWMDGALEFGPRALGHRSILAAAHDPATRDRLNARIKHREPFRPFAPAVPIELAHLFFQLPPGGARLARFMSGVFPVKPEARSLLGAVTHVDGTARVQAVDPAMAPRLHALLHEYGKRTGTPVLLNTSFNLAGEPIVNRVAEGYSTFRRSDLDLLVVGRAMARRRRTAAGAGDAAPAPAEEAVA